jgi:hypothetical protein
MKFVVRDSRVATIVARGTLWISVNFPKGNDGISG